jgi:thioredoxin-like negative regulator of GroEL
VLIVRCDWTNLNDEGQEFLTSQQDRVFRNHPDVRYVEKIHEKLTIPSVESLLETKSIRMIHTGYTRAALAEKNKAERNASIIRAEMAEKPNDLALKRYLADALVIKGAAEDLAEAEALYRAVIADETVRASEHGGYALDYLIRTVIGRGDAEEALTLCEMARASLPDFHDFYYYSAKVFFVLGRFEEAWEMFAKCEETILAGKSVRTRMNADTLEHIFREMRDCALRCENWPKSVEYAMLTVTQNKYSEEALRALLIILRTGSKEEDREIIDVLQKFYDFNDPKDKLFLAKCAKAANDEVLMIFFHQMITDADRAALNPNVISYSEIVQ